MHDKKTRKIDRKRLGIFVDITSCMMCLEEVFRTEENDCGVRVRPNLGAVNRETVIHKMVGIFIHAVRERP